MHYRNLGYTLTVVGGILLIVSLAALFGLPLTMTQVVLTLVSLAISGFLLVLGGVNVSNSKKATAAAEAARAAAAATPDDATA